VKTEEQKNVFTELQKNKKVRRKGLAKPPQLSNEVTNTRLPEQSEAISLKTKKPRRTYRVSTFISEEHGDILDELILTVKKINGKKPKISQILEMALTNLKSNLDS